jgi:hypothetical protein
MINTDTRLGYLLSKEFKDMTPEEQQEYKGYKNYVVMNYLGIPTSPNSIRTRLEAWREETRSGYWD